jgi:hypothetical protein
MKSPNDSLAVEPFGMGAGMNLAGTSSDALGLGLRDRFRGALLGMSLAPAVSSLNKTSQRPAFTQPAFTQTTFTQTTFTDSATGLTLAMLSVVVPKLLRYHDSWERRRNWLFAQALSQSAEATISAPTAQTQTLLLGDFLEMALSGLEKGLERFGASELTRLKSRLTHYDLAIAQQQYYLRVLAEIVHGYSQVPNSTPRFSEARSLEARSSELQSSSPSAFSEAILSALRHRESYGFAVTAAAEWGEIAPAIAGLLAGASGGQAALPVLWQLSNSWKDRRGDDDRGHDRGDGSRVGRVGLMAMSSESVAIASSESVAIADELFAQWAGIQPADVSSGPSSGISSGASPDLPSLTGRK